MKINALFTFNIVGFLLFFIVIALEVILLLTLNSEVVLYKSLLQRKRLKRFSAHHRVHKMEQVTIFTHNMVPMSMLLCIKKETKHFRTVFVNGLFFKKRKHRTSFRVEKHETLSNSQNQH